MKYLPPVELAGVATMVYGVLGRLAMRLRHLALYGVSWYPATALVGGVLFAGAWTVVHRGASSGASADGILLLMVGVAVAAAWVVGAAFPEGAVPPEEAQQRLDLLESALEGGDAGLLRRFIAADGHQAVAAWLWPSVRFARQKPPPPHDRYLMWASKRLRASATAVSC